MRPLSTRTAGFTDSIIRRMTRISNRYGAINLSQGFPDFDPPREITDRLTEIASVGPHQYAITWGAQNFREALAQKQSRWTGLPIDADKNIVVTCGSTEAMMAAMMTVVNPGDKVAIFSPFYENYTADTILTGAEPVYIPLVPPTFTFDANLIEDAFKQGAKALVLCNPSNPCGKVFTRQELEQIADIVIRYDGYVITDEVYEHIVYAPHKHVYISTLPGMWERTISCSSLSKTYSITGWRLGYVIAPERIIDRVKKVHDFLTVPRCKDTIIIPYPRLCVPTTMAIRKDYHRDGDVLSCMWQGIGDIAHIFANFTVESTSKRSKGLIISRFADMNYLHTLFLCLFSNKEKVSPAVISS